MEKGKDRCPNCDADIYKTIVHYENGMAEYFVRCTKPADNCGWGCTEEMYEMCLTENKISISNKKYVKEVGLAKLKNAVAVEKSEAKKVPEKRQEPDSTLLYDCAKQDAKGIEDIKEVMSMMAGYNIRNSPATIYYRGHEFEVKLVSKQALPPLIVSEDLRGKILNSVDAIKAATDLYEACKLALGAFENNHCIDWNVLETAISNWEKL